MGGLTVGPGGGELHSELHLPADVLGGQPATQREGDGLDPGGRRGEGRERVVDVV